jgi:hypothetical protein
LSLSAARRRLRCGNVGTRVWCGFPSSVGRATIFGQDSAIRSHRAPFPQRTRNSAHFGANVVVRSCTRPKCAFPETRAERTFLQIVVQSPFSAQLRTWHNGRTKCMWGFSGLILSMIQHRRFERRSIVRLRISSSLSRNLFELIRLG